ncbi:nitrite reductase [Paenibacillus agricola]|uniref:Nitrite reductase n=1 Tax=Paenibacillus agricola TaxID=2716264 RepID=A0ABX0JHV4_9BACL|nr:nitrite reductase [Paenibacillus agricola]NHN33315.1 nitrite reductase [Paenibacillus agricola]
MALIMLAVAPAFGIGGSLFQPNQLVLIGSIIGEDASIEMTSFKQLYVPVEEGQVAAVTQKLLEAGLQVVPAGFYTKNLITCNFCRGPEEAGLDIAKSLNAAISGIGVPSPLKIGYAGCALGTSEPLLKDIAVVKMRDTFDLYVGGEAKGLKANLAKLLLTDLSPDQLIPIVRRLITIFQEQGKKKEKFSKFVDRVTLVNLRKAVEL